MDVILKCLVALTLSQGMEPEVTWFFQARHCNQCIEQQLEVMEQFYQDQDRIVIYYNDEALDKKHVSSVEQRLFKWRKKIAIQTQKRQMGGVGWIFSDKLTGQKLTMSFSQGSYDSWRVTEILKLLR